MSRLHDLSDTARPAQLSFDMLAPDSDTLIPAQAHNLRDDVRQALRQDIKESPYSRDQLAHGLSLAIGRDVTVAQIDAMVADTKEHRFPAEWIPAWVSLTGSPRLLKMLCAAAGFALTDRTQQDLAELAKLDLRAKRDAQRAAALRRRLQEVV